MPDADAPHAPPPREAAEPHLTFEMLLADTLHEMTVHEDAPPPEPDAVDRLRDEALQALRLHGDTLGRPRLHAYLTPTGMPALPSHPARLDVRS
jgi:hypothetical protein